MSNDDGSEDVNDFLKRIRELGDQRDREDEERTRKLEEEIIQGRKEREARRAERARSLSPTKDSTSNAPTPRLMRSTVNTSMHASNISTGNIPQLPHHSEQRVQDISHPSEAMSESPSHNDTQFETGMPQPPPKPSIQSNPSPTAAMAPSRSNTLSWQQRPSSRGSPSKSRPLSMLAPEHSAARSPRASVEPTPIVDTSMSRNEITKSLGAKDPAFFKQTEDRGTTSAAYRRNQVETTLAPEFGAMRLPGFSSETSRETSIEQDKTLSPPGNTRSVSPSREGSVRSAFSSVDRYSGSASLTSHGGIRSPLPSMTSQRFEPPTSDATSSLGGDPESATTGSRTLAMSPSQGRIAPERLERSNSPTKGLGGFVQSAMLKRSDSVNKRWSAQAGPGLSRGNSVASNRSGYDGSLAAIGGMGPPRELRGSLSRETSPIANSRPTSSHSNLAFTTITKPQGNDDQSATDVKTNVSDQRDNSPGKRTPPLRGEPELSEIREEQTSSDKIAPMSPSKKWSPTKSSWLENAINKPDSPKPKVHPPQQPSWMNDLNKAKQERGSVDLGTTGKFKEINTAGLMRSPPVGGLSKPSPAGGLPGFGAPITAKPKVENADQMSPPSDMRDTPKAEGNLEIVTSSLAVPIPDVSGAKPEPKAVPISNSPSAKSSPGKAQRTFSASNKPKPETPPKKDFKSNLRPSKVTVTKETSEEPEFKNVFGKLKRTQTQNYKAPDELKDNIMRGKADLNVTGGPKKTERRDEFKESILKKREGMKAGLPSASTTLTSVSSRGKDQETPLPEALARRQGLTRTASSLSSKVGASSEPAGPPILDSMRSEEVESDTIPLEKPPSAPSALDDEPKANNRLAGGFNAALVGIISRGPSPMAKKDGPGSRGPKETEALAHSASNDRNVPDSGPQLIHVTKSRARGPKRRPPTTTQQSSINDSSVLSSNQIAVQTNTTKDTTEMDGPSIRATISAPRLAEARPLASISINHRKVSQPSSPRKPSTSVDLPGEVKQPSPKPVMDEFPSIASKTSPQPKPKPSMSPETIKPRKSSTSAGQALPSRSVRSPEVPRALRNPSAHLPDENKPQSEESLSKSSIKQAMAGWQQAPVAQQNGLRSHIKPFTREEEKAALEKAGLQSTIFKDPVGLGINAAESKPQLPSISNRNLPASPPASPKSPKSPPLPGKKPASIANRVASSNLASASSPRSASSVSPTTQASRVLQDFFGQSPSLKTRISIDTQSCISSRSSHHGPDRIKTLRKQIFELGNDGKLLPVPSHQEHILYEENLYLCTHVFGSLNGTRTTEVYLWCGDGVSTSAVEDAQLFCRKVAKENNGKLIILRQGKETANFFQSLGGIVITRRGSSARANSAPAYMLCGRRHVGQIAFDEVNLAPSSLCSGFPYIVSNPSGKLYLWKGRGSGADELGCARLIGMDIGLTGEIEEIDDGREPSPFWEAFPNNREEGVPGGEAERHWPLKASCEKYATRLFSIEVEAPRPKSSSSFLWGRRGSAETTADDSGAMTTVVAEIAPYAQSDLETEGIHVLDAFFEIYVLVPSNPKSLLPTFRAACEFAQEYGILVASAEDRPFVPVSHVVLGKQGVPEGVRHAFRKWDDGKYGAKQQQQQAM
ncbi:MAG: hypothetical protein Q9191_005270, partial [Dirinaria sp. TL-2023a]